MSKLSFSRYNVTLEADYGCFVIPFDDADFLLRYYDAISKCSEYAKNAKKDLEDDKDPFTLLKAESECGKYFAKQIDYAFGEGTCMTVFGSNSPTADMINQFFAAITPYFEEYQNKRKEFTSKYSATRAGSSE